MFSYLEIRKHISHEVFYFYFPVGNCVADDKKLLQDRCHSSFIIIFTYGEYSCFYTEKQNLSQK